MKGYKVLDENMCAINGDGMTYELKEWYEMQGEIIPCMRGYHFCKNIEDVIQNPSEAVKKICRGR